MKMKTDGAILKDDTEVFRRRRLAELNPGSDRKELQRRYGRVWSSVELAVEYEIIAFLAPLVVVKRRMDGKQGSLEFQHSPRFYFNWQED